MFSNKLLNRQDRARLINQMIKYDGKLFDRSSHRLSCQFDLAGLFVTQERGFPFCSIAGDSESWTGAVHVFELGFAYLIMCSHKY